MDDKRTTRMGTLWAHTWDEVWGATVERREDELGRRICGAKTLAGTPCTLTSRHRTGRCEFHGGTDAIGAPVGNANARIHGLYARRLQRCGTHCPMWQHCPFATPQVLALDPKERPNCAYETAEYDAVLQEFETGGTDDTLPVIPAQQFATRMLDSDDDWDRDEEPLDSIREDPPHPPHPRTHSIQHQLALLQVMVSRAAAALSVTTFTDDVVSETDRYHMQTTKVHAALEAFIRLSREHRAALAQYQREQERERMQKVQAESATNGHVPSLADLATPLLERADGVLEEAIEAENKRLDYTRSLETLLSNTLGPQWHHRLPDAPREPETESEDSQSESSDRIASNANENARAP